MSEHPQISVPFGEIDTFVEKALGAAAITAAIVSLHNRASGQLILHNPRHDKKAVAERMRLCADLLDPPPARLPKSDTLIADLNKWADPAFDPPANNWGPELRRILAEARDELNRYRVWVDDLQAGMFVNCVYCGHRYGPGETTPVSMADALKAHVAVCPEHPMSGLLTALKQARAAIASLEVGALGGHEAASPDDESYSFRDAMLGEIDVAIAKVQP